MSNGISNYDFDGGASGSSNLSFASDIQGSSVNPVFVPGVCSFYVNYRNIAKTRDQLSLVNWTFKYQNDPYKMRFFKSGFNIYKQSQVQETIDLSSFFHPLLTFSSYQKQTFNISPLATVTIDSGNYQETGNQASFIFARAYYLPDASPDQKFLFWDYGGNERYPMGEIMSLSGAVKQSVSGWRGWNTSPFAYYGHTGPIYNPSIGGISFTNPTSKVVRLTVIISN
jgi:hypothetical protein